VTAASAPPSRGTRAPSEGQPAGPSALYADHARSRHLLVGEKTPYARAATNADERLKRLDEQLASHEELLAERARLRAARSTLLGESPTGQISQDQVAAYLAEHPGSKPREIAESLGVTPGRVSAHLYRAKTTQFVSRPDGWHLRDPGTKSSKSTR
jgi:DNA-directed RNA polymerase specialized sigma24 family protein